METRAGFRIEQVTAYVAVDEDGDEGLTGFYGKDRVWYPMIAADPAREAELDDIASVIKHASGKRIKKIRFTTRVEVEEIR